MADGYQRILVQLGAGIGCRHHYRLVDSSRQEGAHYPSGRAFSTDIVPDTVLATNTVPVLWSTARPTGLEPTAISGANAGHPYVACALQLVVRSTDTAALLRSVK